VVCGHRRPLTWEGDGLVDYDSLGLVLARHPREATCRSSTD
jgi:hypothetical protein